MTLLDSVLREKRLRRAQRAQQFSASRVRCEASGRALAAARRVCEDARALLWQVMTAADMCVQRLAIARLRDSAARQAFEQASEAHAANLQQADELRKLLARIEKDIEKLGERQAQVRAEDESGRLAREWRDLDDWVLSRRGSTA